jgi:hypothetical protein
MRLLVSLVSLLLFTACHRDQRETQLPPRPAETCACPCAASQQPVPSGSAAPPPPVAVPVMAGDESVLLASASKKMHHGDGLGCLQDLDQLLSVAPTHAQQQIALRAQCEMLSGHCQDGKRRIDDWYREQLAMPTEQRLRMTDALASMYCRGGDQTPRDRLLGAQHRLMQGAYSTERSVAECQADYQTARTLAPQVPPRDADDTLVSSIPKSLFHIAANCFARAGDCAAARRAYEESYPADSLDKIKDPKLRQKVLDDTFASVVPRCAPQKP